MFDLLIRRATVVDPGPGATRVLPEHDIGIRGNRIQMVAPSGSGDPPEAVRVIAGEGKIALPGLINLHAHAAMVLFRGAAEDVPLGQWLHDYIWPMEVNLTPDDIYHGARLAAAEMIAAGVTTVVDHYFAMDRVAQAIVESGMRGHLAWTMFGQDPRGELATAEHFASRWHGAAGGRVRVWLGPHAPYTCPPEFLKDAAAEARRLGLGCHIHVSETVEQVEASRRNWGVPPIQWLDRLGLLENRTLLAHAAHPTPEELDLLAGRPTGVAHCPKTFLKLAAGIAPVVEMRRRGIPVGLGSDGAASNNTLDILEQMRLAALLQKHQRGDAGALPLHEVLALATFEGARALGLENELGRIAPGYLADIILLGTEGPHLQPLHNPLAAVVYSARASDVDTTIVDGRILMEGGRLLSVDVQEVTREVVARAGRLTRRDHGRRLQAYNP